ncbi:MAG: porin family protein [Woeseiaceae bacterium]|jgi:OOP family OmpA-OmpF porin
MMGRVFLTLAIFLLSSSYALAEGLYAGAGIGVTNVETPNSSFEDRPTGWQVLAGYEFNDIFALEGSYVNSGSAKDPDVDENLEAEFSGYVMSVVLHTDMTTPNLFTKLGYFNGEQEVSVQDITLDDDVDGFTAGLGFRHKLANNFAIRGEANWYESDFDNLWSVGIGVEFSFGF